MNAVIVAALLFKLLATSLGINASSAYEVINNPLNWKEENHQSIECMSFHIFVSHFFSISRVYWKKFSKGLFLACFTKVKESPLMKIP